MNRSMQLGVDVVAVAAFIALVCGWYWLDILIVTVGPIREQFVFPDAWSLIYQPVQTLSAGAVARSAASKLFSAACVLALLLVFTPHLWRHRLAWLGYTAPFVLMCTCAALAYLKYSSGSFVVHDEHHTLVSHMTDLANQVVGRASKITTRRLKVGMGTYVSSIASFVLAVLGAARLAKPLPTTHVTAQLER